MAVNFNLYREMPVPDDSEGEMSDTAPDTTIPGGTAILAKAAAVATGLQTPEIERPEPTEKRNHEETEKCHWGDYSEYQVMLDIDELSCETEHREKKAKIMNFGEVAQEQTAATNTSNCRCSACNKDVDGKNWNHWVHLGPGGHLADSVLHEWVHRTGLGTWIDKTQMTTYIGNYATYLCMCCNCLGKCSYTISKFNQEVFDATYVDEGDEGDEGNQVGMGDEQKQQHKQKHYMNAEDSYKMICRSLMAHQMYNKAVALADASQSSSSGSSSSGKRNWKLPA